MPYYSSDMMKYIRQYVVVMLVLVLTLALVQMVESRKWKTTEKEDRKGTEVGHRANRGIVDLIPKSLMPVLKPLHRNVLSAILASVGFVRRAVQLALGSAPNPHLERRWQELDYDLRAIRASEIFLDRELAKDISQFIKDIHSLEKYVNTLIRLAQKLEKSYINHRENIKQLLKDTQDKYHSDYEWIPGMLENVYMTFGGKREELHLSKELMPLWERLKLTSTKICHLNGLQTLLELALSNARTSEDFHVDVETLIALCDEYDE